MGITGLQTYDSSNAYNNAATGRKSSSDDKNATISDFIKKFGEARQITAQELKEDKDWRDMTDSEWGKLLSGFDKYIDTVKEQIKENRLLLSVLTFPLIRFQLFRNCNKNMHKVQAVLSIRHLLSHGVLRFPNQLTTLPTEEIQTTVTPANMVNSPENTMFLNLQLPA